MFYACVIRKRTIIIVLSLIVLLLLILFVLNTTGFNAFAEEAFSVQLQEDGIELPIIMYHSILKDANRHGDYVISPDTFQQDMMFLQKNGYTTIFVSELIDYVCNNGSLPDKPVIVTFDDGYLNNLIYILPILQELDMKAVISIIGSFSQLYSDVEDRNASYAHLSWEDIKTLSDSNLVELGNHTYAMHEIGARKGSMKKRGESETEYQTFFREDVGKLQQTLKDNVGVAPEIFTYPFGFVSPEALPVIKEMGFKAALTCSEKVNYIARHDSEKLYNLCRFNRPNGISTEKFMEKLGIK